MGIAEIGWISKRMENSSTSSQVKSSQVKSSLQVTKRRKAKQDAQLILEPLKKGHYGYSKQDSLPLGNWSTVGRVLQSDQSITFWIIQNSIRGTTVIDTRCDRIKRLRT